MASLVRRFRRGDDQTRRQLLWVLLALLVVVIVFSLDWALPDSDLTIIPIALIPLSILVAILRYRLLDIRLVFSRSLLYVLLTGAAVGVVPDGGRPCLDPVVRSRAALARRWSPRCWSRSRSIRCGSGCSACRPGVYGARHDPVRAMAEVGARLGGAATRPGYWTACWRRCAR